MNNNTTISRFQFRRNYRCYYIDDSTRDRLPNAEYGGKIILPPSALDTLTRHDAEFPLLFKLTNIVNKVFTHVGVLEFIAEDGRVYIPKWIMDNLGVGQGRRVQVENVTMPVATFTRLQPQSVSFLEITNPKAVLENTLRNFSCLTVGDTICIHYNDREYRLKVLNTRPKEAVRIIECDMEVEFEKPVGFVEEPSSMEGNATSDGVEAPSLEFVPFSGKGYTLSGKKRKLVDTETNENRTNKKPALRGIPDFDYQIGTLVFMRSAATPLAAACGTKEKFSAFHGKGQKLVNKRTT